MKNRWKTLRNWAKWPLPFTQASKLWFTLQMKYAAAFPLRRALLDTFVLTALKQYLFLAIECFQGVVHFSSQSGLKVITLPRWFNQTEFNEVKWGKSPANSSKPTTLCCATYCQCRMYSARKHSPFQQCKIQLLPPGKESRITRKRGSGF